MLFDFLKKYSEQFNNIISNDISGDSDASAASDLNGSDYHHDNSVNGYSNHCANDNRHDSTNGSPSHGTSSGSGHSNKIRCHIIFHGRVQGVGFRYTSYHLAESLGITGWVRNEYDGSVSCELQGPSVAIDTLIERISSQRWIDVTDIERTSMDVDPEDRTFRILD